MFFRDKRDEPMTPSSFSINLLERLEAIETALRKLEPSHERVDQQIAALVFERALQPVLEDIIALYDRLQHVLAPLRSQGSYQAYPESFRTSLLSLDDEVLEILQRQGIEPVTSRELDSAIHQVIKRIPTEQAHLDRAVARRHRCGFRRGDILLRREEVEVYRFEG